MSVSAPCLLPAPAAETWAGIKVEVKADHPVISEQSITDQAGGFQRLSIKLSNKGDQPLTIEKINITIPLTESLSDEMQMVFGGSCMGRTPLLRHDAGSQTKNSSSHMYEMIRLSDQNYLFAGSLILFATSLVLSLSELFISTHSIEIELSDLELDKED